MKFWVYFHRMKKHLFGSNLGIAGNRVERIVTDGFIKLFFEWIICFFAKPISVMADKRVWRHKNINYERKRILYQLEDSYYSISPLVKVVVNFGFILADNDTPYYGAYRNIIFEIQQWKQLRKIDLALWNLKDESFCVKESEVFNHKIQCFVEKHGGDYE